MNSRTIATKHRTLPCAAAARQLVAGAPMGRSLWNIRKRHESLTKPLKGKRLSKRKRERIGLEDALERKRGEDEAAEEQQQADG